ncbi:hypothetical protein [Paenarthrobacter aurescens]|uniref:hypothetical protein n=1 Tax=Paenarthrobacter aurescens TaxID=43663 RepID=UPI0021BEB8DA|nr:hypothetical protein [Paenarthrobacter aurescens]MCT9868782.1 hypothetical protein [Paenarthrobacter aurescens]
MNFLKRVATSVRATVAIALIAAIGLLAAAVSSKEGLSGSAFLARHELADGGLKFEFGASYTVIFGGLTCLALVALVARLWSKKRLRD